MLARERGSSESNKSLIPETEHRNRGRTCAIVWIIVFVVGIFFIIVGVVLLFAVPSPSSATHTDIEPPTEDVISQRLSHHPPTTRILLYAVIGTGGFLALLGFILSLIFCIKSRQNEYIKESLSCDQTYQSTIHNSPSRLHSFLKGGGDNVSRDMADSTVSSRQTTIHSINDVNWIKKYPRRISTGGFKLVSHKRPSLNKVALDSNSVFNQRLQSFNRTYQDVIPEDNNSAVISPIDSPTNSSDMVRLQLTPKKDSDVDLSRNANKIKLVDKNTHPDSPMKEDRSIYDEDHCQQTSKQRFE